MNDSPPSMEQKYIQKYITGLSELTRVCGEAGMHPMEMIGPLKTQLASVRQAAMPSKKDEQATEPHKRVDEAWLRRGLRLEPHEPIPPMRDE